MSTDHIPDARKKVPAVAGRLDRPVRLGADVARCRGELALSLIASGVSQSDLARAWRISPSRVRQIVHLHEAAQHRTAREDDRNSLTIGGLLDKDLRPGPELTRLAWAVSQGLFAMPNVEVEPHSAAGRT